MSDVKELSESEMIEIIRRREKDILAEEVLRFVDENRPEIIRRAQVRITEDAAERKAAAE